jgi:outer membrane lipase/esterase
MPSAFGLTNVVSPCITPNVPPFTCDAPDEYLYWDGIHPSAATHAIIASEATSVLLN